MSLVSRMEHIVILKFRQAKMQQVRRVKSFYRHITSSGMIRIHCMKTILRMVDGIIPVQDINLKKQVYFTCMKPKTKQYQDGSLIRQLMTNRKSLASDVVADLHYLK